MSEKTEKKKKKKAKEEKKEEAPPPEPAEPPPPAEPEPFKRPSSKSSSKKRQSRSGSDVFAMFSVSQVAEYKEGFALMDLDKDGELSKNDLRATFDMVGKIVAEKELDEMLADIPDEMPCTFTQFVNLFATRQKETGEVQDDDDTVVQAFCQFDEDGWINADKFKHALMTWCDRFTAKEIKDAFETFYYDEKGKLIDTGRLLDMLLGKADD